MAERQRLFLPDHLAQVRAIAMRGVTEEEMSEIFDISEREIERWKRQYPLFKKALDEGYTDADQAVLSALYQTAVGYTHDEEKVFQWDGAIVRADTIKHYKPDIAAIKLWITNRQREYWKDRQQVGVNGGTDDNAPIGLRDESKLEVMASILALIKPKPDNVTIDGRTGQVDS
jgi:3-deoxy-D-arabino-heptulosonate 7-phosphate (DAHP) synthase class II